MRMGRATERLCQSQRRPLRLGCGQKQPCRKPCPPPLSPGAGAHPVHIPRKATGGAYPRVVSQQTSGASPEGEPSPSRS
jgi:hypothetical protein